MKVLVVDEEIPYPANSGKRIRTYNLLKHLAKSHDIHFVCRSHAGDGDTDPNGLRDVGIHPVIVDDPILKKSGVEFNLALMANLFSRYPYSVASHRSQKLQRTIHNLLINEGFDLIHCEWSPYAININPLWKGPRVVMAHNVEAMVWRRSFEVERQIPKKAYICFQWKKMESFERSALPLFDRVIAVSDEDRRVIEEYTPRDKTVVVENGVDVDYFKGGMPLQSPNPWSLPEPWTGDPMWMPCFSFWTKFGRPSGLPIRTRL